MMFFCAPAYVNNCLYIKPDCIAVHNGTKDANIDIVLQIRHMQYISMAFSLFIASVGTIGNTTMIFAIVRKKLLGRSTCIFVFSIAMADAVAGGLGLPGDIMVLFSKNHPSSYLCKLHLYVSCFSKTAVFYTLCAMVAVRAYSTFSGGKRTITAGRCMFFISLIWFFSTAYNIWAVVIYDSYGISVGAMKGNISITEKTSVCSSSYRFQYLARIFTYLDIIVIYAVPFLFVFVLVTSSMHKYNAQSSTLFHFPGNFNRFRLPMLLSVVFVLCQTPWEVVHLFISETSRIHFSSMIVLRVVTLLSYSRGCFNILVYLCFRQYVYRKKRQSRKVVTDTKQTLTLPVTTTGHRRIVKQCSTKI